MSALIASLFAVGAAPAAALDEDSKPNSPAATSACVGDATGDMMFSDVSEMHTFRADINCLAYYGVTIGYDQFASGESGSEALTDMAGFEADLAKDADNNDTVAVTSFDPTDAGDVARFVLTTVADA